MHLDMVPPKFISIFYKKLFQLFVYSRTGANTQTKHCPSIQCCRIYLSKWELMNSPTHITI